MTPCDRLAALRLFWSSVLGVTAFPIASASACITPGEPYGLPTATVERVSDGDTVLLRLACQGEARAAQRGLWAR